MAISNQPPSEVVQDHDVLGTKADVTHEEAIELAHLTEEEVVLEKKLKRKIDILILPLVFFIYLMNYIDRNNYASARLQGLQDDLGMSTTQYQAGLGILFVGYILGGIPSNQLLNWSGRPSIFIGGFTIAWGLVSALTCLTTNFGGILACRLILGFVEAPFFPGVLYYLSKWYTKRELSVRMSFFYSGGLAAGAVGNLIAAGILHGLAGHHGLAGWQWLYIIEGVITTALGVITILILPDFPHTWKRLSPDMKRIANRRMAIDAAEADVDLDDGMSHIQGLWLAIKDPRVLVLTLAFMCKSAAGGFQFFLPTLTKTLGFDPTVSLLLVAPPYTFVALWSLFHSYMSDRFQTRYPFVMYPLASVVIGCIIFMTTDAFAARYIALFMMLMIFCVNGTFFAWIATTFPRPPAKRAAAYSFINAVGNSASIWTPYTYRDQDKPYYRPALILDIGLLVITGSCFTWLAWRLRRDNKRLERLENEDLPLSPNDLARLEKTAEMEGVDLATARRLQKGYRYII